MNIYLKYMWEALTHPKMSFNYASWYLFSKTRLIDFVASLTNSDRSLINSYLSQIVSSKFESDIRQILEKKSSFGWLTFHHGRLLYLLTRFVSPSTIVETGVFSGISSAYILRALRDNSRGTLYSIDLPDPWLEKHGLSVGFVVPLELKNRWKLILGRSSKMLRPLLSSLGEIDLFFHDSEHNYENMMFEFKCAWPHIRQHGILLADDIEKNSSFRDFCKELNLTAFEIKNAVSRYAAVIKT